MKKLIGMLAIATIAATPAMAQKGPEGRVDRPEFAKRDGHKGAWNESAGNRGSHRRGFSRDRMFALMDANHDGKITKTEFDRFHVKMREHHRGARGFAVRGEAKDLRGHREGPRNR